MRTLLVIAVALALPIAAACGDKEDTPPATASNGVASKPTAPAGPLAKKLEALATKGCACKTHKCGEKVHAEITAFGKTIKKVPQSDTAPMQAAQARFDTCTAAYNPFIISYKRLVGEICACKDKACAQVTSKKFTAWIAKLKATKGAFRRGHLPIFLNHGNTARPCFEKFGLPIPQ